MEKISLRKILLLTILTFIFLISTSICYWWYQRKFQLLPYEKTEFSEVYLHEGGKPMCVICFVTDKNNLPIKFARIDIRNNSGGNEGLTNKEGKVEIALSEMDLEQILVEDIIVFNRPNAYELGYPNVKKGLEVKIIIKNRKSGDVVSHNKSDRDVLQKESKPT